MVAVADAYLDICIRQPSTLLLVDPAVAIEGLADERGPSSCTGGTTSDLPGFVKYLLVMLANREAMAPQLLSVSERG
jgi:hypothetical protein